MLPSHDAATSIEPLDVSITALARGHPSNPGIAVGWPKAIDDPVGEAATDDAAGWALVAGGADAPGRVGGDALGEATEAEDGDSDAVGKAPRLPRIVSASAIPPAITTMA